MQSLDLGLVLDPSDLGSLYLKFGTMYKTTIFLKMGHFPRETSFSGFFGYTCGATKFSEKGPFSRDLIFRVFWGTLAVLQNFLNMGHFPEKPHFQGFLVYTCGATIFLLLFVAFRDIT